MGGGVIWLFAAILLYHKTPQTLTGGHTVRVIGEVLYCNMPRVQLFTERSSPVIMNGNAGNSGITYIRLTNDPVISPSLDTGKCAVSINVECRTNATYLHLFCKGILSMKWL